MDNFSTAFVVTMGLWTTPGAAPCDGSCWVEPLVPADVIEDVGRNEWVPSSVCDGDILANTGARDGKPFNAGIVTAAFDEEWLKSRGLRYWKQNSRTCIPARDYGDGWLEPEACGNAVRVVSRGMWPSIAASVAHGLSRGIVTHNGPNVTHSGGGFHGGVTHRPGPQVSQVPVPQPLALLLGALAMLGGLAIRRQI